MKRPASCIEALMSVLVILFASPILLLTATLGFLTCQPVPQPPIRTH